MQATHCSACVIRVAPGEQVRPGALASERRGSDLHHHGIRPRAGRGRGQAGQGRARRCCFLRAPCTCSTTPDAEEMKVVCFFAPPTGLDNYKLHEGVDFPETDKEPR